MTSSIDPTLLILGEFSITQFYMPLASPKDMQLIQTLETFNSEFPNLAKSI